MGICVGMQILFARGIEHGVETEGLDEWPGTVEPLAGRRSCPTWAGTPSTRPADTQLFAGLDADARFYFVHSYAVARLGPGGRATPRMPRPQGHLGRRTASRSWPPWRTAPLWATQFHPEKSGDAGAQLLTNWIGTL